MGLLFKSQRYVPTKSYLSSPRDAITSWVLQVGVTVAMYAWWLWRYSGGTPVHAEAPAGVPFLFQLTLHHAG